MFVCEKRKNDKAGFVPIGITLRHKKAGNLKQDDFTDYIPLRDVICTRLSW